MTTRTKPFEYLAERGFLLHHVEDDLYWITNPRGGKVFTGTKKELRAHLKETYYGEPIA